VTAAAPLAAAPGAAARGRRGGERGARRAARRLVGNTKGALGALIVAVIAACAVFAPWVAPYDPLALGVGPQLALPSRQHPFGTDELGRDLLSRVIYGARPSLEAGLLAVALAALVGAAAGLAGGYYRGWPDALLMRVWDTLLSFPAVFLAIGVVTLVGPGFLTASLAVALINIPVFARLIRATTLAEAGKDYVTAARSIGARDSRIIWRAIFPNCSAIMIVQVTIVAPEAVLFEAGLSFLGLGTQPPAPSWGAMLQAAQGYLSRSWTYGIFPGLAITLLAVGLSYLGDSLQDVLDPRRTLAAGRKQAT
jgi:peptide/nickel transport system permease protein